MGGGRGHRRLASGAAIATAARSGAVSRWAATGLHTLLSTSLSRPPSFSLSLLASLSLSVSPCFFSFEAHDPDDGGIASAGNRTLDTLMAMMYATTRPLPPLLPLCKQTTYVPQDGGGGVPRRVADICMCSVSQALARQNGRGDHLHALP